MESSDITDVPVFRWKWSTPSDHGVRLLALENSDFVFIERTQSNRNLSADLARKISDLGAVAAQSSVILVNDEERVEALVDLAQNAELLPSDFSIICVIGIAPRLTAGIGSLRRRTQIANGLWIVSFAHVNENNATRDVLERYVLGPWIERRSFKVLTHLSVPSDIHAPGTNAAWECKLVSHRFPSHHLPSHGHDTKFKKGTRVRYEKFGTYFNKLLRESLVHSTAESDLIKGPNVETAANALDSLYESLEGSQSGKPIATEEQVPEAKPLETPDAMQRSIALRERLQGQVKFVTSAQWAKWRGIQSNPAAALGKYKRQKRVFAVRFSKQDRYPAFQFADDAQPLPVIHDILTLMPEAAHGWPLLSWFEAKNTLLGGRKPSEIVATEPEAALNAAQRFYSRDD